MNTNDLAARIAAARGISKADARDQVNGVIDAIIDAVDGGELVLSGFGKFRITDWPARQGRNPRSGATIIIAPRRRISFTPAKGFKDRVAR